MTKWYAHHDGSIRAVVDTAPEPKEGGWHKIIPPDKLPEIFDPKEDEWLHLIRGPENETRFVRARVTDGMWESMGVCTREESVALMRHAQASYAVGYDDEGDTVTMDRIDEREDG